MFFETEYQPVIEDYTKEGRLSLLAVLKILENAGNRHSDQAGDGVFKGNGNTKAWVLTDWQLAIDAYPSYSDAVKAQTWSQVQNSPLIATRDFLLYRNGEPCVRGTTRWVLYDIANGHPCKIEADTLAKYGPEPKSVFDTQRLAKIAVPESFQSESVVPLRRSDIDFNNHVHNLMYLDFALQALPADVYERHDFKTLRITYKTAVRSDKEVVCRYAGNGTVHTVCIYGTDGQIKTLVQLG